MELQSDDQSVIAEEINPQTLTNQQKCTNLQSIDKQIRIFTARKEYVTEMRLTLKRASPGQDTETTQKLEADAASLMKKIKTPFKVVCLNYYLAQCLMGTFKYKNAKKRAAEPIIRPAKLTVENNGNNNKMDVDEFKIPRKTFKSSKVPKENNKITATKLINLQFSTLQIMTSRMSPQLLPK
ncbi:hypothetical protein TNIN_71141 [Trichonephila inaurata madagascariensis]|uniref:Uncharacterized protein n=1 Tax=Trichonephila inaurata madagascariensis TaxID=2747483 RepID=A0A8X7C7V7_9ARAC|nr:hypothetical protein TNIN_71141 [Trichonephila inaurata madagascariensis]